MFAPRTMLYFPTNVTLACLIFLPPVADAQEPDTSEPPAVWIKAFEQDWDDSKWGPASPRRPGYMRPLDDDGWKTRMRALRGFVVHHQAGSGDRTSVSGLADALQSKNVPTRILAAQALGFLAPHVPIAPLKDLFKTETDKAVLLYAADSLGMQGDAGLADFLQSQFKQAKNRDVQRHLSYAIERQSNGLAPSVASALGKWDDSRIDTAQVGKPAPDFALQTISGDTVRLSDFRGKQPVVLVFVYGDT